MKRLNAVPTPGGIVPNAKFTARLSDAVRQLREDKSLKTMACDSGSLFSPVFRDRKYRWIKVMDSDGLLVSPRRVADDEGRSPAMPVDMFMGVVVQGEDATSQGKPNPVGKAALSHVPNGIWVDLSKRGRHRLDGVLVVFVLPEGAAPRRQARFQRAKRNVQNASDLMPGAKSVVVPRGASASAIAKALRSAVRGFLVGTGRPSRAA